MEKRLVAAFLCVAGGAALAATASAQQVITTAYGDPEIIAVAVDPASGTTYFATDRPGAIFRVTGAGPVLVAGVAGGQTGDGVAAAQAAVFPGRNGLAIDASGNVFFSEPSLHRIRELSASTGAISTVAGTGGSAGDPSSISGNWAMFTMLGAPGALAFNPTTGDLFVADEAWDIVYRIIAAGSPIAGSSTLVMAVGGDRSNTSIWIEYSFYNPFGYSGDGGPAIDAKLNHPRGITFDAAGNLYIADTGNNVVRRVDTSNVVTTVAGTSAPGFSGDSGPALGAQLFMPSGVAVDAGGDLLIADTSNHVVRMVAAGAGTISTIAGTAGTAGHGGDGAAATNATLAYPTGVAVDTSGGVLIADSQNNRVRSVAANQAITTIAQHGADYSGDGKPGGNALNVPLYVVFDRAGNMFFSDSGNSRIRRADAQTGQLSTVAGTGIPGYGGDGGAAIDARLNCPAGLAVGLDGALYVADPCAQVVRRIDPGADAGHLVTGDTDEIVSTYAGNGIGDGYAGPDGSPAASVSLFGPYSLAMNSAGQLYIGEPQPGDIRTVSASGTLGTYANGMGSRGLVIDGQDHAIVADDLEGAAIVCDWSLLATSNQVGRPWSGLSLDGLTRLFVTAEEANSVFQLVDSGGGTVCGGGGPFTVTRIAGLGTTAIGYSGDGGAATSALLNHPAGTAFDGVDTLYVADTGNDVLRRLRQPVVGVTSSTSGLDFGPAGILVTTPSQTVTLTSSGTGAATFGAATLSGTNQGDFAITSDGCLGRTLAPGQTCQIAVAFRPTDTGARAATLLVNDDAASAPQPVALSGIGVSLEVTPAALSFGDQTEGVASAPAPVTIRNSTPSTITIQSLSFVNPADFAVSSDLCTGVALASGASCTFGVAFTPHAPGPSSTTLNVASSAGDSPRAISVGGNGVAPVAKAQLSTGSIAFGSVLVGSASAPTTISLTSVGTAPLSIASVALTGNEPTDFTTAGDTCTGATLNPGQTCTVQVTFRPAETCNSTAALTFTDGAADSPQSVALGGQGTTAPASLFQAQSFCTSRGAQADSLAAGADGNVWMAERGSAFAPPAIGRMNAFEGLLGEDAGALRFNYRPFELTMSPDGSYAYDEADGANPPGQSYVKIVNTAGVPIESAHDWIGAIAAGPDGGFLVANQFSCADWPLVTDFAPDGITTSYTPTEAWILANTNHYCVETSALGVGPDGAVWIGTSNLSTGLVGGTRNGFIRMTPDGIFADFLPTNGPPAAIATGADGNLYALVANLNPACSLQRVDANGVETTIAMPPSVFSLGCAGLGEGADGRLWIYGSTFTGTVIEAAMVAFDPIGGAVTAYPMPQFGLYSTPSLIAGPDEGIWFVAPGSAVARFDIGGGPARAFVTPRVVSLPFTSIGVPSKARTIYVRSTGTAPLTVSGITIAGPDAAQFVVHDECSGKDVAPGEFCTVLVASRPTTSGSHKARLLVASNDGFSPQSVRLAEFAVPPAPTIVPSSVAFPGALVGANGKTATFVLTNPADRPLTVSVVTLAGADAQDFKIENDQCGGTSVSPGGTCAVTVRFVPTAAGSRTATLIFTDSANPTTQTAALSGTGQTASGGGGGTTDAACNCATGLFVNPAVVLPSVKFVSATVGASPKGVYKVTVTPNGPQGGPAQLVVTKGSTTLVTFVPPADATWPTTAPAWGFSPDDDRFVVHYQTNAHDTIDLFDLTGSTPNQHAWEGAVLITSDGTGTVPTGSVAFSPNGDYIVAAQIESFVGVGVAPTLTAHMNLVSSAGVVAGGTEIAWQLSTPPANKDMVESAHWGFSPDDQSFAFIRDTAVSGQVLELINLPSGTVLQQLTSVSDTSKYVQFGPCGEVLAVVTTNATRQNPMAITLYSTKPSDPRTPIAAPTTDLPDVTVVLMGTPTEYTAHLAGYATALNLAPDVAAAGCAAPTVSGDAGGASHDTSPQFTTSTPPLLAIQGQEYSYTFHAVGSPAPTYTLDPFAPSWLKIDSTTGKVFGTPPLTNVAGQMTYSVTAANRASFDVAGPFEVTVSPPTPPGDLEPAQGPFALEDERPTTAMAAADAAPATSSSDPLPPAATTLLLPNNRGSIVLAADVTSALSTFAYTETDAPAGALGPLVFAGLDFTLTVADALSGDPVPTLVDPPRATIALRHAELDGARIRDLSRLGLYWWSGSAWVNQLPCDGCGVSQDGATLTAALTQAGEYMLAATPPPAAVFSIATQPVHVTVGDTFGGIVATFPPAIPLDVASDYAAFIDWGDGQVSPGTVSALGGGFALSGAHAWSAAGSYPVFVTVVDGADAGSAQSAATVDPLPQPPQFTSATPPLTGTEGAPYSYTFAASGVPAPAFALAAGAPSWLTVNAASGVVSGTPPPGTASFTYSVVASNGVAPDAIVGPFAVTVATTSKKTADLSIAIAGPAAAARGSIATYTIVVTNNGPSTAFDGTVLLLAGPDAFLVGAAPPPFLRGFGVWTWCFGRLDPGRSITFTVNLRLGTAGTAFALGAVESETPDPKPANNVTIVATKVR